MKESRAITIVLTFIGILLTAVILGLEYFLPNFFDHIKWLEVAWTSLGVSIITAIIQYFVNRRRIINTIYDLYFDLYRSYYNINHSPFLFHFNVTVLYKKLVEVSSKVTSALDDYHGLIKEKDKKFKQLNPDIKLYEGLKVKKVRKTILKWCNRKEMVITFGPLMLEVEKILLSINTKRFIKDKENMIKMHNYLYS